VEVPRRGTSSYCQHSNEVLGVAGNNRTMQKIVFEGGECGVEDTSFSDTTERQQARVLE